MVISHCCVFFNLFEFWGPVIQRELGECGMGGGLSVCWAIWQAGCFILPLQSTLNRAADAAQLTLNVVLIGPRNIEIFLVRLGLIIWSGLIRPHWVQSLGLFG